MLKINWPLSGPRGIRPLSGPFLEFGHSGHVWGANARAHGGLNVVMVANGCRRVLENVLSSSGELRGRSNTNFVAVNVTEFGRVSAQSYRGGTLVGQPL